jgi:hypothetical protein
MSIGICPTSKQPCNFVPAFHETENDMPRFTDFCKPPDVISQDELNFRQYCGRYAEMAVQMTTHVEIGEA